MTLVAAAVPTAPVASSSGVGPVGSVLVPVRDADEDRQQNGDHANASNTAEHPDFSNRHGRSLPQRMPHGFEASAK